jgi:hypothetical protein
LKGDYAKLTSVNKKALAVSLVCIMLFSSAILQIAAASSAKNGKILLWEDFENKRNLNNVWSFVTTPGSDIPGVVSPGIPWTVIADSANAGNHVLQAKFVEARGRAAFAGDTRWKDYTLEARTITSDSYMGLIVYADSAGKNYYDCYVSPNSPGGLVEMYKHTDGIWGRTLVKEVYSDYYITAQDTVDLKIKVTNLAEGTLIQFFFKLSGAAQYPATPQGEFKDVDSPFTSGRIGLLYYGTYSSTEASYELFDNVIVTAES